MKKGFLGLFIIVSLSAFAGTPDTILAPVEHIYTPLGFDSNDNTEIIVEGYLPNLCHKSPMTAVRVDGRKILITVTALKYHPSNPFCPEVIVPFVEAVSVGLLKKGQYDIIVNGRTVWERKSQITIAEPRLRTVDDNIYANVQYVEMAPDTYDIKLKGTNPNECYELDKIEFVSNKNDTYSVLPKMRRVSENCERIEAPFTYETRVPKELQRSKVLLHVRAMSGRSVNFIFHKPRM